MKVFYHVLQVIVLGAVGVLLWFFIAGLSAGYIDASNLLIWLVMLALPVGALTLGMHLSAAGKRGAAVALLVLPAAPAFLYGLFVLMFIVLQPDMR